MYVSTKEALNDAEATLNGVFRRELEPLKPVVHKELEFTGNVYDVADLSFGNRVHMRSLLITTGSKSVSAVKRGTVARVMAAVVDPASEYNRTSYEVGRVVAPHDMMFGPCSSDMHYNGCVTLPKDHPTTVAMQEQYTRYVARQAEYRKIRSDVRNCIQNYKSFNEAVKAHPELLLCVSQSLKDKLEAKVTRAKKEKEAPVTHEFDPSSLAQVVVSDRLSRDGV